MEPKKYQGRLTPDNAALLLIDHQVGLFTGVRDIPVAELKHNVVALANAQGQRESKGRRSVCGARYAFCRSGRTIGGSIRQRIMRKANMPTQTSARKCTAM